MQQDDHGLQGCEFQARKDVFQLELQITLFAPFVPVDQRDLIQRNKHKKTRRLCGTEQNLCGKILIFQFQQVIAVDGTEGIFLCNVTVKDIAFQNTGIRFSGSREHDP